jgi:hypothetical protein
MRVLVALLPFFHNFQELLGKNNRNKETTEHRQDKTRVVSRAIW